jgi:hypothetical protein
MASVRQRAGRYRPSLEQLEQRRVATVTYHGGALLRSVGVEALFLGIGWRDDPTLAAVSGQLAGFLQTITNSSYLDMLTRAGYRVGRGSYLDGPVDPLALGPVFSDGQIQKEIAADVLGGLLQRPDANRLYVVYVEPGVTVTDGGENSSQDFVGYHSDFRGPAGAAMHYAVVPYPGGGNATVPGLSPFEALTKVTSHELAESATDPEGVNVGRLAWWDNTWRDPNTGRRGGEIADITDGVFPDLNGYVVQAVANRNRRVLVPAGATLDPRSAGVPHAHHAPRRHHRAR